MKTSLLDLHDKVSTLTFMFDTFMKEMTGMVVEDVVVEEDVDEDISAKPQEDVVMQEVKEKAGDKEVANKEKEKEKKEAEQEEEENPEAVDATPIQTISPTIEVTTSPGQTKPSKKRKTLSRK